MKSIYHYQKSNGFTLIEILVVATIMIVLTAIGIASFSAANQNARDAKRKADLETLRQAMVLYKTQSSTGVYPQGSYDAITGTSGLTPSTGTQFLTPPVPRNPPNNAAYLVTNSTSSSFCFCALMDNPAKGNSGAACTFSGTTHYCVRQP